jgi:hypothetical protein
MILEMYPHLLQSSLPPLLLHQYLLFSLITLFEQFFPLEFITPNAQPKL